MVWRWNKQEVIRPSLLAPRYSWFKAAIFALLVLNTGTYLVSGTFSEGIDSIAWLTLLALFELETGSARPLPTRSAITAVHGIRLAALAAVGVAAAGFLYNEEWLDSANSLLWIAVVVLLEWGVRRPAALAAHRAWYSGAAAVLYAALGALAFAWLWQGEWFAAYDAALWLVAFLTIELNVLEIMRRPAPAGNKA
ncbi:MAG TPA: hypothetical protein VH881_15905 [Burkholderiales bacterium]